MRIRKFNFKKHKLFIRWIETYLMLVVVLAGVTIPIYIQSYHSVKKSIISDTYSSVENGMQLLLNDTNTYSAIIDSLQKSVEYNRIADLSGEPKNSDYVKMASLQRYYRDMLLSSVIQDNAFIMFSKNDVVLSKYSVFSDMKNFYGPIWQIEGLSYEEMRERFFEKRYYGEFLSNMVFCKTDENKKCDIVFVYTVSDTEKKSGGGVIFSVYDSDKILSLLGLNQIAESGRVRLINNLGEEIVDINNQASAKESGADIVCTAPNSSVTIEVTISDEFYSESLAAAKKTLLFYAIVFFSLGLALSLVFAYRNGKPLRNLIKVLSVNEDYPIENEYDYICNYITKLSDSSAITKTQMLDNMLVRLLFTRLTDKESEEFESISDGAFGVSTMVLIKSDSINWEKTFNLYLDGGGLPMYKTIIIDPFTEVIFFDGDKLDKERINEIILELNRKNSFKLKAAASTPYRTLSDTASVFARLQELIKYAEFYMVLTLDVNESGSANSDYTKKYYADSKPLNEYLRSGDSFETNKIIYKQWYQLSTNPGTDEDIANLFYYQAGIITEVVINVGYEEPMPKFKKENDILANALCVTEYINGLCGFINENRNSGNQLDMEIIKYINKHYTETSFYLMTLSEEFNMSSRAVTGIIKQITGNTFSDYLKKLRLSRVARLLIETDRPIQSIATQSGFESANSLLKSFKKEYGVSPTEFRKNKRMSAD